MGFVKLRDKAMHDSKTCFKCNIHQSLSEFYKHKMMADGRLNKCKTCTKHDAATHRAENIEHYRAYDRARGNRQGKGYRDSYVARYPNKYKAHTMTGNAIRDKKLFKKPCCACGSEKNIHAHHDDYLEPLNVRWLCAACHSQWHAKNGEAKNP